MTRRACARQQASEFADEDGVRQLGRSDTPSMRHAGDNAAGHIVPDGVGYHVRSAVWQAKQQNNEERMSPPATQIGRHQSAWRRAALARIGQTK